LSYSTIISNLFSLVKNNNLGNQFQVHQISFISSSKSTHQSLNLSPKDNINLFNKHVWIFDYGVTSHAFFFIRFFSSYNRVKPYFLSNYLIVIFHPIILELRIFINDSILLTFFIFLNSLLTLYLILNLFFPLIIN